MQSRLRNLARQRTSLRRWLDEPLDSRCILRSHDYGYYLIFDLEPGPTLGLLGTVPAHQLTEMGIDRHRPLVLMPSDLLG